MKSYSHSIESNNSNFELWMDLVLAATHREGLHVLLKMLFDGESKRRLVSSSGRKRDISRNSVIEESRKQREQRLLEKQRMLSAIVIQKYIRRYLKQKKTQLECLEFLNQQLTTISRIQLVLPNFCLPLETVIVLLKYSVFSQAIAKGFENWKKSISLLTRSFQSCDSVANLSSSLEKVNAHSFQILLSSFLESLFPFVSSLNHRVFIFEFLSTLLRLMQDLDLNHGSLFLKCIRGAIGILRHKPYQLLQKISFLSNQTEMQNLFVLLLKFCEIGLYDGDSPANSLLLGYFPPEVQ